MATTDKKKLSGYDPLAWLAQENESFELEDLKEVTDAVQEVQLSNEDEINNNHDSASSVGSETDHDFFETDSSEIDMSAIANSPEEVVSDQSASEDVVDSTITLDATLSIQHVVKLYEQLKRSYAAHNAIQINATHVSSIDTATLQLLVALKKDAAKQKKTVVFAEPSQRFIESLELLGLREVLEIDV
jgi:anti-anti-sigma regulatory factor